jgi:rhamnosyltransferase
MISNGGRHFAAVLDAVSGQTVDQSIEVIVVDSGSGDGSVDLARRYGASVHEIPPAEFGHGRTRNLGAGLAQGDPLVFLSQDAAPSSPEWLEALTAGLEDPAVAGVYGRQLPDPSAPPPERFFLDFLYGPAPRRQVAASPAELSMETALFSNVNSAIRRSAWEQYRFAEDLVMAEDGDWARRVLLDGHTLLYEPAAAVHHSHRYSLGSAFRRFFDSGAAAERNYLAGEGSASVLRRNAVDYARSEMRWLVGSGNARWIPYTIAYEGAKFLGLQAGARHRLVPRSLRPRLSAHPEFWR